MFQRVTPILVALAAVLLIAAGSPTVPSNSKAAGLTVHEWGTFTSIAGEDGGAIEWSPVTCKDDLPGFVDRFPYRNWKFGLLGTVRMETPVIYFYTPREITAHVAVEFPQGMITEWYPAAKVSMNQTSAAGRTVRLDASMNGIDTSLRTLTSGIEWREIQVRPGADAGFPEEDKPSPYYAARNTDAAPLTVAMQQEKFLFYRGVGRFAVPLSARFVSGGQLRVEKRGDDPVYGLMLFENRGGRIGYRNVGALRDAITLDSPALNGTFAQMRETLEAALVEQGLFAKEAHAMVETWRDSWFEEGMRLLYILPLREVDAILPLRVEPAPSHIARAFVGRVEVIAPADTEAVKVAIDRGDRTELERRGRFLRPILQRINSGDQALLFERVYGTLGVSVCR